MSSAALVTFSVTEEQIAATKAEYARLSADTPKGYEEVRIAIGRVRETRVAIEKRRVEQKAEALDFGRRVDTEAKKYTTLLLEIEDPLKAKKQAVDEERFRAREAAETAKREALEAEVRAKRDAEEAELRAKREAEEKRLATDRQELEAEKKRLADLQAKIEAAIEKAAREEFERQAKIQAEEHAAEQARWDQLAAARHTAELAALRPDVEKLTMFAAEIRALEEPSVQSAEIAEVLLRAMDELEGTASQLEAVAAGYKP